MPHLLLENIVNAEVPFFADLPTAQVEKRLLIYFSRLHLAVGDGSLECKSIATIRMVSEIVNASDHFMVSRVKRVWQNNLIGSNRDQSPRVFRLALASWWISVGFAIGQKG